MKVAFMIIGSEILQGKIHETNLLSLARAFYQENWVVDYCLTIKDQMNEIVEHLKKLSHDYDIIITSGGLGPTEDDLTKTALGLYLGTQLVFHPEAFRLTSLHYERINRPAPNLDHPYCFLPTGVVPVPNPVGIACGLDAYDSLSKKMVFMLPGVPREFNGMVAQELIPRIRERFQHDQNQTHKKHLVFKTRFVPEEKIFKEIVPSLWDQLTQWGDVSSLPHVLGVDLGVFLQSKSEEELLQKETTILSFVLSSALKEHLWQIGTEPLPAVVIQLAQQVGVNFGVVESCTGGLISSMITDTPAASSVFCGGLITYQTQLKETLLHIGNETLTQYGVVSEEVAMDMAEKGLRHLRADITLSTTGLAGPDGGTQDLPVGTVAMAVATKISGSEKVRLKSFTFRFHGDRKKLKETFATRALHLLLDELILIGKEKGRIDSRESYYMGKNL